MMYNFFRAKVSFNRCDWLAMSISGRSHVVSTNRGADSESEKNSNEKFILLSPS